MNLAVAASGDALGAGDGAPIAHFSAFAYSVVLNTAAGNEAVTADALEECHHDLAALVPLFELAVEPLLDFWTFFVRIARVGAFDPLTKFAAHVRRFRCTPLTLRTALVVHVVRGAARQRRIVAVETGCFTRRFATARARWGRGRQRNCS